MQLHKAERKRSKLRGWLSGVSSSGKTYTALTLFKGFGGKTALIDTENGRGDYYGDEFEYDVLTLQAPFTPERYIEAIKVVEAAGYDNLIIDSLSHEWQFLLDYKTELDSKPNTNQWTNWKVPTARHNALMEYINRSPLHIISTARAKRKYTQGTNAEGKKQVVLLGLEDIQRNDAEYDMTVEFRLEKETHKAECLKDNTKLFLDLDPQKLTVVDGEAIKKWLDGGAVPVCANHALKGEKVTATEKEDGKDYCTECATKYREMYKA